MLDDPEDLTILEGVLVLAKAFRRKAIAEGVETIDHGLMLLQLGCQIGQGYQIARPMRATDFPAWAAGWRPDPLWMKIPEVNHVAANGPDSGPPCRCRTCPCLGYMELEELRSWTPPCKHPPMDLRIVADWGRGWKRRRPLARGSTWLTFARSYELHQKLHAHADHLPWDFSTAKRSGDGSASPTPGSERPTHRHRFKDNLIGNSELQHYARRCLTRSS